MRVIAPALAAAVLLVAGGAQAGSIDIPTDGSHIIHWGPDAVGVQSYGQVFTAPQPALLAYSLTVSGDPFAFVSQVFAWDGSGVTGAALYTSEEQTVPATDGTFFFGPSLLLTTGQSYIALVTSNPGGVSLGGSGLADMAANVSGPLGFAFALGDPSMHDNWHVFGEAAAFHADFADHLDGTGGVPEPATWAMMLLGFGVLGAALRARRKVSATAA